ncbi:MAG: hypothetical protein HON23_04615 [Rickettsiales bacterium]|nr:hypothetical protein [Rickettsiales bacterium]
MIKVYNILMTALWPIIRIYLNHRIKIGKEDIKRFNERIGIYKQARPDGKLIWFHAASVGESISIISLIKDLSQVHNILITSGTTSSAKVLSSMLPSNVIHQFVPIDRRSYVKSFLNHFRPNLAFFVESEIWPNLLNETKKQNIKIIIGSARITPKPILYYKLQQSFFQTFIPLIDLVIPQDSYTKEFYEAIAPQEKITDICNLKLGSNPLPFDDSELERLQRSLANRKILLAASTHDNEEDLIAQCHYNLRKQYPGLLTIIAPRHPGRSDSILQYLAKHNLTVSQRSKGEEITSKTDIYLADTIGEMGLFFKLSPISLMGGTLVNIGGHNILEPAQLNSLIIIGPYTQNFTDVINIFKQNQAITQIQDQIELEQKIALLLNNQNEINKQIVAQNKIMIEFAQIRENYVNIIKRML